MGKSALLAARRRSWFEAMECLFRGYREVTQKAGMLVKAS
jgi:hypothetical protein